MTPNREGSMVLLSPSRTITETLTSLASSTGQQLEEVWDEVGYSPEERASQLSDLIVKFRDLCEQKIAEEKGVAETFRQTIAEAKEEIKTTSTALKTLVDPHLLQDNHGQTLTDELATLEAALEGLRATANAAKEDLQECRDFLIESHEALGLEMNSKWRDITTDLTAPRREEFHLKKSEMKQELAQRMTAVIQLVRDCQHLHHDLRIEGEKSDSELDRRIAGSLVRSKDGSFIMASKFRSETCTGISATALEELTKRVAELHSEKKRRKTKLQEMGAEIAMLWEKLHVSEEEQLTFTASVQGLGLDTIEKGEAELERLQFLKSQMLGKLIEEARTTIKSLWDQINATTEQRRGFEPCYVQDEELFTDELLDKHEEYIRALETRLEEMKPIMRIIERREIILKERMKYEELQKDSDRLKQRGAAMTRQLMEEEKMAKRIKRELPRLTDLLVEKLSEWKDKHGDDFQYKGEIYFDAMDHQEEEWNQYKVDEQQRKLKKKQEEQVYTENRYVNGKPLGHGHPAKKKAVSRPLADAQEKENVRHPSRSKSHEVTRKAAPLREMGKKQSSVRF